MNRIASFVYPPVLAVAIMSAFLAAVTFVSTPALADTPPQATGPCYDYGCGCSSELSNCALACSCTENSNNCQGCEEYFDFETGYDKCVCAPISDSPTGP